jgi:3-hydroxyisobutyrate dehydrogenase-like beta-hydroxyacid dehydrogenase
MTLAGVRVGFIGLGIMGKPMALNLARHFPLTVWNRSPGKYAALQEAGARVAASPSHVLRDTDVAFLMLFNESAISDILDDDFSTAVRGKTLINTSSIAVDFSKKLADSIEKAGGKFIEMPVSGSKVPAERGELVGMLAGDRQITAQIKPLVEPLTTSAVYCGPIGSGLRMKYAINLFLFAITAGLSESMNLARAQGLDLQAFGQVLNAGALASPYTKVKVPRMLNDDWAAQAAINDGLNSTSLIQSAAQSAGAWAPITELCHLLNQRAVSSGLGEEDLTAVAKLFFNHKES